MATYLRDQVQLLFTLAQKILFSPPEKKRRDPLNHVDRAERQTKLFFSFSYRQKYMYTSTQYKDNKPSLQSSNCLSIENVTNECEPTTKWKGRKLEKKILSGEESR